MYLFSVDSVMIINSLLCVVAVSSLKLLLGGENIIGITSFLVFITKHILLQLIFISLLLITKGDFKFIKISDVKAVYGISIINGIFGQWIFSSFTEESKKVNLFMVMIKALVRCLPFISQEDKEKIIEDLSGKEGKEVENLKE